MLTRVIPLRPWSEAVPVAALSPTAEPEDIGPPVDRLGRSLRELRISVIDRCNFRCVYCMPKAVYDHDHAFLSRDKLLGFDEIERAAAAFIALGVRKIRLTGGEPLLRSGIEQLIARLAALRTPEGRPIDLAMTTNGSLLGGDLAFQGPIQGLYDWHDKNGKAKDIQGRIAHIDLVGTVAHARVEAENWTGYKFTDLFLLIKLDGAWKIINKVFHLH